MSLNTNFLYEIMFQKSGYNKIFGSTYNSDWHKIGRWPILAPVSTRSMSQGRK